MKSMESMNWSGAFAFGSSIAVFRGHAGDNVLHAHAAVQVSVASEGEVEITDANGTCHRGAGLVTGASRLHTLSHQHHLTLVFLEPQHPVARALSPLTRSSDVATLPAHLAQLIRLAATPQECIDSLVPTLVPGNGALDRRLSKALDELVKNSQAAAIAQAALHCGLSTSQLRVLARQQLDTSLSQWVLWKKLALAGQALLDGASLADAAFQGGFADQAHFSRAMRKTFGITPGSAHSALRIAPKTPSNRSIRRARA